MAAKNRSRAKKYTGKKPARFVPPTDRRITRERAVCDPSIRAKKRGKKGRREGCHVEMVFKPDARLRFCFEGEKDGLLVPVNGPAEAKRIAKDICACAAKKTSLTKCITKVTGLVPAHEPNKGLGAGDLRRGVTLASGTVLGGLKSLRDKSEKLPAAWGT